MPIPIIESGPYPISDERAPDEDAEVFALGHAEQMQIDLALQVIRDAGRSDDGSITVLAMDAETLDIPLLARLQPIFAAYGTVTILRVIDQ